MHDDILDVNRDGAYVGQIRRTPKGSTFKYDDTFLTKATRSIAFNLPLMQQPIVTEGVNLHTFFAGLLPEGLRLKVLVRNVKTSEDDLLTLLAQTGADCIGDISAIEHGKPYRENVPKLDVKKTGHVLFQEVFADVLEKWGPDADTSIAGIQPKVSAGMISFPSNAASRREPKAFILKLQPNAYPKLVENEHFFMNAAKACGIVTAKTKIVYDKETNPGLLVTRFDRVFDSIRKRQTQLHQEDCCQLLDRYPADKYRISTIHLGEALSVCSAPILEIAKLIQLYAFSYLIGNGDLHAKNISVLTLPNTRTQMSPAYDLLSTLPYGDQSMAIRIDGRDKNIRSNHLIRWGQRFGVREIATRAMLEKLLKAIKPWIDRVPEIGFDEKKTKHLQALMRKRAQDLSE